ncbi:MAG: WYL domain-containing protein [Anaeromyxobacter sp.]
MNPTLSRLRRLLLVIPAAAKESLAGRALPLERARRLAGARSERQVLEDVDAIKELYLGAGVDEDDPLWVQASSEGIEVVYASGLDAPLALSLPEGAMLLAALKPFEKSAGAPVRTAARKLRKAIPEPLRPAADQLVRGVDVVAPPPAPHLDVLRDAADRRLEVTLQYRSVADGKVAPRVVEPRLVFHRDGVWYLAAFNVAKGEEHLFRVDRMAAVEVGVRTFERHRGPDPARYAKRRLYFASGAERDVKLRLEGAPARLALRRGGGRVTANGDGTATVTKRMTTGNHLASVVLGHGGDATVTAPEDVREDLRRRVAELRKLYG